MLDSIDTLIAFVLIMLVVSLLITIAVQMVAALLNLRGLNLAQGVKRAFAVINPDGDQNAKQLANFILKGRFLSDSFLPDVPILKWWRHTAAIRPQEVFDAIHRIAIGKEPVAKDPRNPTPAEQAIVENAKSLLIALGVDKGILDTATKQLTDAGKTAQSLTDSANNAVQSIPDQKVRQEIQGVITGVVNAATNQVKAAAAAAAAAAAGVSAAATLDSAYQKFQYWICSCQERAQQWVTMHTRILTVIFAFVAGFGLQIDAVEIFKLVSSNKAVRDKLVAQANAISSQAEKTLSDSKSVLQNAYDAWLTKVDDKIKTVAGSIDVDPTYTREKLTSEIQKALANIDEVSRENALKSLDSIINDSASEKLEAKAGEFRVVKADLEKTGFELFPGDKNGRWGTGFWWCGSQGHRWGILFSVGLLSLGAPFWYNALKNLVSLRSAVAQSISKEQEQAQKQGDGAQLPEAPPTVK